jgi:hypothetical protein
LQEASTTTIPFSSERYFAAGGIAAAVAGAGAVWYFDPTTSGFFPACPLYTLTGFACPGCGMTRGFHALFHGDIVTALDYNALIPLIIVFFGYLFLSMLLVAVRGRGLGVGKWSISLIWGTLVILLIFGILRNLPFYPFTILFP